MIIVNAKPNSIGMAELLTSDIASAALSPIESRFDIPASCWIEYGLY